MKENILLRLRAWFVPSFDWRYSGNLLALGFVLFCSFFFARSVFAYDGVYWGAVNAPSAGTAEKACDLWSNWHPNTFLSGAYRPDNPDNFVCYSYNSKSDYHWCKGPATPAGMDACVEDGKQGVGGNRVTFVKKTCPPLPSGDSYLDSICGVEPVDCPDSGVVKRVGTAVNGTFKDGKFVEELPANGFQFGGVLSAGGCGFVSPNMLQAGSPGHGTKLHSQVKCTKSGSCFRYQNFVSEGAARPAGEYEPWSGIAGDPEFPEVPNEQTETSADTRESRTSTTSTDPITEQVGDSTRTTQTTTTTETRGDGSVVQSQDDVTTVTRSDGITRTDTQTTVTTTNADGSKTVETTNNISYTQNPQTIYNIDNSTGRISVTATGGGTATQQTRTTEGFAPDGTRTSRSTEEGPVTGDESAAEEPSEEKTCDSDPLMDKCIGDFEEGEAGSFGTGLEERAAARSEYGDLVDQIRGEIQEKLNFGISGGGSVTPVEISFKGATGSIGISKFAPYFDKAHFGSLVLALAALASAFIVLGASSNG